MGRLDGQLALVSGAAQGLGRAIATRLAAEGAQLAVNDRRPSPELDRLAAETAGVTAVADVSDPDAVDGMVAEVERAHGPIEVLVANHAYMSMGPFVEHDPEDWWRNVDVNLSGTFFLLRAVLPGMRKNGGGRIVIIASEFGVVGWANATAYAASKTGLISLTKTLGRELGPENILVNAIAPGIMDTPQLDVDALDAGVSPEEIRRRYAADSPMGRIGRPEEVAALAAFLSSDGAGAFVGQILQPNGGTTRGFA
ncbi:MAG TPA: SDR family oxidoreductase [Thermoleophilaceae bacterium]|nr:SDR family oxidoreductase [Thermoleophilaceae bacterium]